MNINEMTIVQLATTWLADSTKRLNIMHEIDRRGIADSDFSSVVELIHA